MRRWADWLRRTHPYDGQGLAPPEDAELAAVRAWAAARFRARAPLWARPFVRSASRLIGAAAADRDARRFANTQDLPPDTARRLVADCVAAGAPPIEAYVWRALFGTRHPLPPRSAGLLLGELGDRAAHRRLADKQATAALLDAAGLATPPLLELVERGRRADFTAPHWREPGALFVKPRRGAGGRGAVAIDVLGNDRWRADGRSVDGAAVMRHATAPAGDDLLVQRRMAPAPALADLTPVAAPVLRLTTMREPDGAPILHSALLSIGVPYELPRDFLRGHLYVPIDPANGQLRSGLWFDAPTERHARVPWGDTPLDGRALAGFADAVRVALAAAALVPGVALINWDVIITAEGPVILEGNSGGSWLLTMLPAAVGIELAPLVPLLRRWQARGVGRATSADPYSIPARRPIATRESSSAPS